MTIDEAIDDYEFKAEFYGDTADEDLAHKHGKIAEWLRELRRVRMEIGLLKTLIDGFKADAQKYKAENAKLRELVVQSHECKTNDGCCEDCYQDEGCCPIERDMEELLVEVE